MKLIKSYRALIFLALGFFVTLKLSAFEKKYVDAKQLQTDSLRLGKLVLDSGFEPTFLVALWRGGAPIGVAMTEYFEYKKKPIEKHISIRTSGYNNTEMKKDVTIFNMEYVLETIKKSDKLLIVDDLIDSGKSILKILETIKEKCGENTPEDIRIAVIYYKPKSALKINHKIYYLHETSDWIVFPHELEGLTIEEIEKHRGAEIAKILS
jgi:uncharacterized protein